MCMLNKVYQSVLLSHDEICSSNIAMILSVYQKLVTTGLENLCYVYRGFPSVMERTKFLLISHHLHFADSK